MHRMPRFVLAALGAVLILSHASSALCGGYAPEDVRTMGGKVPSLSAFPGFDGVAWRVLRNYRMLPDGSVEAETSIVAMVGERVPSVFQDIRLPVPEGWRLEADLVRWYNPLTWREEGVRKADEDMRGGVRFVSLKVPSDAVGRVVTLKWVQRIPSKASMGALVEFGLPIPVWEEVLSVEVPAGKELAFRSFDLDDPVKVSSQGVDRYTWSVSNQGGVASSAGIVQLRRPYVVFGTSRGESLLALRLSEMERKLLSLRADVSALPKSFNGKLEALSAGADLMDPTWGVPWDASFDAGRIGVLKALLESEGYSVKVFWQPVVDIPHDPPVAEGMWLRPVLRALRRGAEEVLFFPGQSVPFGQLPPELCGSTLWAPKEGGGLEPLPVPFYPASQSRVLVSLRGEVDSQGIFTGTLEVLAGGMWHGMVKRETALDWLSMGSLKDIKNVALRDSSAGLSIRADVSGPIGVRSDGGMLLMVPSVYPRMLDVFGNSQGTLSPRFPFIVEQRMELGIPKGLDAVVPPALKASGAVLQRFSVSPRKGRLSFLSTLTVKAMGKSGGLSAEDFIYFARGLSEGVLLRGK
ncbi:MAG: hypothetical protein N2315_08140 [Thermanaerothrix sp.]|nr:hypothetical protein [Thermanaerothrix sp.]